MHEMSVRLRWERREGERNKPGREGDKRRLAIDTVQTRKRKKVYVGSGWSS